MVRFLRAAVRLRRVSGNRPVRACAEAIEGRLLLSVAAATTEPEPAALSTDAGVSAAAVASVTQTADLPINNLVAAGKATVSSPTPFDIGSFADIFDGSNSSLLRSAAVNPLSAWVDTSLPVINRLHAAAFTNTDGLCPR